MSCPQADERDDGEGPICLKGDIRFALCYILWMTLYKRCHLPRRTRGSPLKKHVSPNSNDPEWWRWLWWRGCYFGFKLRFALWPGALCFLKGCRGVNTKLIMLWLNLLGTEICLWRPVITSNINGFIESRYCSSGGEALWRRGACTCEEGVTADVRRFVTLPSLIYKDCLIFFLFLILWMPAQRWLSCRLCPSACFEMIFKWMWINTLQVSNVMHCPSYRGSIWPTSWVPEGFYEKVSGFSLTDKQTKVWTTQPSVVLKYKSDAC